MAKKSLIVILITFLCLNLGCKKATPSFDSLALSGTKAKARYFYDSYNKWQEYIHLDFINGSEVEFYQSIEGIYLGGDKIRLKYIIQNNESETPTLLISGILSRDVAYLKKGTSINWSTDINRKANTIKANFEIDKYSYILQ